MSIYLLCPHVLGWIDGHRHGSESWRLPWVWCSSCSSLLLSAVQQSFLCTSLWKGNPGSLEHQKEEQVHHSRNVLVFAVWILHLHASGTAAVFKEQKAVLTQICADWLKRERRVSPKQLWSHWHNHLFSLLPPKKVYVEEIYSHGISPNQQAWITLSSALGTSSNSTILIAGRNVL